VTLSHVATGTVATATSGASDPITCSPAYPGGGAAGDLAVLTIVSRHDTEATPTVTPGGGESWVSAGSASGGGGTFGAGTGPARITWFTHEMASGSPTAPTVNLAGTNTGRTLQAVLTILHRTAGVGFSVAAVFVAEATAGTGWTQAYTSDPGITSGDLLILGYGVRDDQHASFTAMGVTATSATISAVTERADAVTGNGNDQGIAVGTADVTAGTATANATQTATIGTSESGEMGLLRVRESKALELIQELDGQSQTGNQTFTATLAQVDDLIVLIQADNFYTLANLITPTGTAVTTWTEQTANGLPVDGGTSDNHAKVWTGTVTTAGGTVIANRTNVDDEGYAAVFVLRGTAGTPEFDTGDGSESDANATAHVAPSVTPTSGKTDDFLLCVFGTLDTVVNYTLPGGMTAYTEQDVGGINTYRAGSEQLASDSATGTRTATSSVSTTWFAVSVLIKTATAGPTAVLVPARPRTAHRRNAWRRRGDQDTPVPAQVTPPPPPTFIKDPTRRAVRGMLWHRGRSVTPVPLQVTPPPPPVFVKDPARRAVRGMPRRRDRRITPVPAQMAPPAPGLLPRPGRYSLRGLLWRRGRAVAVPPPQVLPAPPTRPYTAPRSRRIVTGLRRAKTITPIPPQQTPAPPPTYPLWPARVHRTLLARWRSKTPAPVPPQVVTPPGDLTYIFRPPTTEGPRIPPTVRYTGNPAVEGGPPNRLGARMHGNPVGITVLREGGVFVQVTNPLDTRVAAAERVYMGGYEYVVTGQEAVDLLDAGYVLDPI